jgi:DHA2 family multidrug resistance protein
MQGAGMGIMFVPMNLIAFATLSPRYRTDGSAFVNLTRNIGSAMGVSLTSTYLSSRMQVVHAQLAEHANVFNRNLAQNGPSMFWNLHMPFGAVTLNSVIDRNAAAMAYSDDFLFMLCLCAPVLLVVFLVRKPTAPPDPRDFEVVE